jgi:hypothetical protein
VRLLVATGSEHHCVGLDVPAGCSQQQTAPLCGFDRGDIHSLPDRCSEFGCVILEMADDVVSGHEAIGVCSSIGPTRQLDRPVRGHQTEAVPTSPPALAYTSAFENDMFQTRTFELMADGKAGMAGADDDYPHSLRHGSSSVAGDGFDDAQ